MASSLFLLLLVPTINTPIYTNNLALVHEPQSVLSAGIDMGDGHFMEGFPLIGAFDVDISNVSISEDAIIVGDSRVVIEDTYLDHGARFIVRDNAYVLLRNITASYARFYVKDNATLILSGLRSDYIYVSVGENASLILDDCTVGSGSYTSPLYIYGFLLINNSFINKSYIYVNGGFLDSRGSTFYNTNLYLRFDSRYNIENSGNYSYVQIIDDAQGNISSSSAYRIGIYENAKAFFYNVTVNLLDVYADGSLYLEGSHVVSLSVLLPSGFVDTTYFGGHAEIVDSVVKSVYAYSAGMTLISDSNIDRLYYTKIYTGEIIYNSSGIFATNVYDSYIASSSTINVTYEVSMRIFTHSPRTNITYSISTTIYLFDCDATISGIASKIYIRAYNTSLSIDNTTIGSYTGYNSDTTITNIILEGLWISASGGSITIENSKLYASSISLSNIDTSLIGAYINDTYMSIVESTIYMENVIVNNTDTFRIYNSHGDIRDSLISNELKLYSTSLRVENVTFDYLYMNTMYLEDANFLIDNGFAYLFSGTLRYGVEDVGGSSASTVEVDNIYVYGSTGNITGTMSASGGLNIEVHGSSVVMESLVALYGNIYVTVENLSSLYVWDVYDVWRISCYNSTLNISNAVLNDIYLYYSVLNLDGVNITEVSGFNATLNIYNSIISDELSIDFYVLETEEFLSISHSKMNIVNSQIRSIFTFAFGSIYVENSEVDTLVYTFSDVTLKDTNITGIILNNHLAQESVYIRGNSLISGTLQNLLHIVGLTHINSMADAIVADLRDNPNADIKIENSSYAGIVVLGGSVQLYLDNISVLVANCNGDISIVNSTIRDVLFGDATSIMATPASITILNSELSGNELILGYAETLISDSTLNLGDIMVAFADELDIVNVLGSLGGLFLWGVNHSRITIGCSVLAVNSSVGLYNEFYSSVSIENTELYIENAELYSLYTDNTSKIMVIGSNISTYRYTGNYKGTTMSSYMERTNISDEYPLQVYLASPKKHIISSENLAPNNLATIYNNSYLSTATPLVYIALYGYLYAEIENFTGIYTIRTLYIDTKADTTPPKVLALNNTIEYEIGVNTKAAYFLNDDVPDEYTIKLNGTLITQGSYGKADTISVNLNTIIENPATYLLTITAKDGKGSTTSNSTKIIAYAPEPPKIVEQPEETYTIKTNEELNLKWIATDLSPKTYAILINNTEVKNSTWLSGQEISYIFKKSNAGTYSIKIIFRDLLNQETSTTVTVHVENENQSGSQTILVVLAGVAIATAVAVVIILKKRKK